MSQPLKTKFRPRNPKKYRGNPGNIIARSGWERDIMNWLDLKDDVKWWSSEEVFITYKNEVKKKWCRYYPDFVVCFQRDYGDEVRVIEVKPDKYTKPPKTPKRKTKSYYYHLEQYITNQCKWKETQKYCEERGWNFSILTENDVGKWNK